MASNTFNARKLMELAVQTMRLSKHELRKDGKACPHVGAVLYKPDGTIETAFRGELRQGNHAEYTLIDRKNRDKNLEECILFATLEPCAPESRKHPKLGCAERIVNARISKVWVGIEDPDPTVARKGIKYLEENGVIVEMFERDLQEQISAENHEFLREALDRAAISKAENAPAVSLSKYERSVDAILADLSTEALERYCSPTGIRDAVASEAFIRRLVVQGLAVEKNGTIEPNGFGLMLFGKEPRMHIRQSGLLATIIYPSGQKELRNFDGPMVLIPELVEQWLRDKLPNIINRDQMTRSEVDPVPFQIVREAIVNALVHRDYDIEGAKCHLEISTDTIVVKSPGAPVSPIKLEELQRFTAPTLSRNPELQYVFVQMHLAEERGIGMASFRTLPDRYNLPLPTYRFANPYLVLTIYRSGDAIVRGVTSGKSEQLSEDERSVLQFIATHHAVTSTQIRQGVGFDQRKTQRILKRLLDESLIHRTGHSVATSYNTVLAETP